MLVQEIVVKTILSKSQVYDYALNPYVGCQHGCTYCYARFMKRFTGHKEPWGEFVDVKINAPALLSKEVKRKPMGRIWVSGVCDPYQPLERKYQLTRKCLEILIENDWPVTVQTRSTLVLRDIDLLTKSSKVEVGITVNTGHDGIRRLFEPHAPPVHERIKALGELHSSRIRTFAMIAPMLPGAESLADAIDSKVDYVLVDRLNYNHADWVFRKHALKRPSSSMMQNLCTEFQRRDVDCRLIC